MSVKFNPIMLTFAQVRHNARSNIGGRRMDSAAFSIPEPSFFEDKAHEAHLPAEQSRARPSPWFPQADVNQQWPQNTERPPCAWPQEAICVSGSFAYSGRAYAAL